MADRPSFLCRHIKHSEVDRTFDLINLEGWHLTREKFALLCKNHPKNFFVAVSAEGEIAGTLSYFQTFADEYNIGNVVIKQEFRGLGVGRKLLLDTMAMVPHKSLQLVAWPNAEGFYLKLGFTEGGQRHEVITLTVDRAAVDKACAALGDMDNFYVAPYTDDHLVNLIEFDYNTKGYDNSSYISAITQCAKVLVGMDSDCKRIVGYVIVLKTREKIVIDGLVAPDQDAASLLFRSACNQYPDVDTVKIQTFPSNQFLRHFGHAVDSFMLNRFCIKGTPNPVPEANTYCVSDCDYVL